MIALIAAVSQNYVIGNKNTIPWVSSADLKLFKKFTKGDSVIMGRKTWESLKETPLPDRNNIIITSNPSAITKSNVTATRCLECAITNAKIKSDVVWIIGGASLYKEALDKELPDVLKISRMNFEVEGDTFFPDIPKNYEVSDIWNVDKDFSIYTYKKMVARQIKIY